MTKIVKDRQDPLDMLTSSERTLQDIRTGAVAVRPDPRFATSSGGGGDAGNTLDIAFQDFGSQGSLQLTTLLCPSVLIPAYGISFTDFTTVSLLGELNAVPGPPSGAGLFYSFTEDDTGGGRHYHWVFNPGGLATAFAAAVAASGGGGISQILAGYEGGSTHTHTQIPMTWDTDHFEGDQPVDSDILGPGPQDMILQFVFQYGSFGG